MEFTALVREVWRRELLRDAGRFFAKRLRISSTPCHVVFTPAPQLKAENAAGLVTRVGRRGFLVAISLTDIGSQLQVIAHEMVHVQQLISGRLVHRQSKRGSRFLWKGEDLTHLAYHRRPWELEAMSKEMVLAQQFIGELREYEAVLEARLRQ